MCQKFGEIEKLCLSRGPETALRKVHPKDLIMVEVL